MIDKIYDEKFYSDCKREQEPSAKQFAETIYRHFRFNTLADIGCGCGIYAKQFEKLGIKVTGIDGSIHAGYGEVKDLRKPILGTKHDLAICIEVAEHIEPEFVGVFLDNLIQYSNTIVFTGAPPGQGGVNHVNCQPFEYWIKKFRHLGYELDLEKTKILTIELFQKNVISYIPANIMVFKCSA